MDGNLSSKLPSPPRTTNSYIRESQVVLGVGLDEENHDSAAVMSRTIVNRPEECGLVKVFI